MGRARRHHISLSISVIPSGLFSALIIEVFPRMSAQSGSHVRRTECLTQHIKEPAASKTATDLSSWPWCPLTLQFVSPELEANAISEHNNSQVLTQASGYLTAWEATFFSLGLLATAGILIPTVLSEEEGNSWPTLVLCLAVLLSYTAGTLLTFASIAGGSDEYYRWRSVIVVAARCSVFATTLVVGHPPEEVATAKATLVYLLARSPVLYTALSYLVWPLRVRELIWVQFVSLLCLRELSTTRFCEMQEGEEDGLATQGFSDLGKALDRALEVSLFGGLDLQDGHKCSCRAVATFAFLFLGVLLPACSAYWIEVNWRSAFLKRVSGGAEHQKISHFRHKCLESMLWLMLFGMQVGWIVLRRL